MTPIRFPELHDRDWLHARCVDDRLPADKIAEMLGCSAHTVKGWRARHGLSSPVKYWQLNDAEWLHAEYVTRERTAIDIASEIGCSIPGVRVALRRHKLTVPRPRIECCSVEGCDKPHRGLGYCQAHYLRVRRYGDPHVMKRAANGTPPETKFWERIDKSGECWLWTGGLRGGYGFVGGGDENAAHRLSWIIHHGPIPEGIHVHHKCAVRRCVNPDHLELATCAQNVGEMNARKSYERRIAHLERENADLRAQLAEVMPVSP